MNLLPDDVGKNARADQPWLKSETDRMLDLYFDGCPPDRIAIKLKRNPKAVRRALETFTYNERDRAVRYEPRRRVSRVGRRWTENEILFCQAHQKLQVPSAATVKVLARKLEELSGKPAYRRQLRGLKKFQDLVTTADLAKALRYAYHVWPEQRQYLIADEDYDAILAEEIEFGGFAKTFKQMQTDGPRVCSGAVKALALYLVERNK